MKFVNWLQELNLRTSYCDAERFRWEKMPVAAGAILGV